MRKLTLQWRVTLLTALVLIMSVIALTMASMANAENSFMALLAKTEPQEAIGVLPENEMPAVSGIPGEIATQAQLAKQSFDLRSILYGILLTMFGTAAVYFAAGKALRPLQDLSRAVKHIDESSLSQRLPETISHDEIGVLTDSFNEMLSRLEDAFLRQKRFTANAAHELKTPLATMKTGIQVLSADKEAEIDDYKNQVQRTLTDIDRLTGIVDDLLLLASAGEGMKNEKETVWLEPLFEAIQDELTPQLEQRKIVCSIDCGEVTVSGNASLLYRTFFNLVENACKYGHTEGRIKITAKKKNREITVSVIDDGPGIGQEHLPYIFDAFYRVDKSRSREIGGSGLGLSLVKMMVEAEGGSVSVESDGKSGTCFTVSFPA